MHKIFLYQKLENSFLKNQFWAHSCCKTLDSANFFVFGTNFTFFPSVSVSKSIRKIELEFFSCISSSPASSVGEGNFNLPPPPIPIWLNVSLTLASSTLWMAVRASGIVFRVVKLSFGEVLSSSRVMLPPAPLLGKVKWFPGESP